MTALRRAVARLGRQFKIRPVDQLLYELRPETADPVRDRDTIAITRHQPASPSGILSIDRRLRPRRECYLIRDGSLIMHESWLCFDVRLHGKFGFDRKIPVIGYCQTHPDHRGKGLYPRVLRRIATDMAVRAPKDPVYILVSPANAASIRGIERAGARLVAQLTGSLFLGVLWRRRAEMRPR